MSVIVKLSGDPGFCRTSNETKVVLIYSEQISMQKLSFYYNKGSIFVTNPNKKYIDVLSDFVNLPDITFYGLGTIGVSDQVTGIAMDWISGLIYWSDALHKLIGAVVKDTYAYWRPVIDSNLVSPQDVAVYPLLSYLFWIDGGSAPKIERSTLSGKNRTVLVPSELLSFPSVLEIDVIQRRLYWFDSAMGRITSVDFDGSNATFWSQAFFTNVSAFAIFKDIVFFGYKNESKYSAYSFVGSNLRSLCDFSLVNLLGTVDMMVFAPENQPNFSSPCSNDRGQCDHLCFTESASTRQCGCSMGLLLFNSVTCYTQPLQENFLILTDTDQRNIFQVHLITEEVRALVKVSFPIAPTAMDYDPASRYVYWVDGRRNSVMKTTFSQPSFNNTSSESVHTFDTSSQVTSVALDFSVGVLYVANFGRQEIGKLILISEVYQVVISSNDQEILAGERPQALALDVANSLLYWSKCSSSTSSIVSSDVTAMSSHRTVITDVAPCITAIAVDPSRGVLYWGTNSGTVETLFLNGTGRRRIYNSPTSNYTGMTLDDTTLYLTHNNRRWLQKLDRKTDTVEDFASKVFTAPNAISLRINQIIELTTSVNIPNASTTPSSSVNIPTASTTPSSSVNIPTESTTPSSSVNIPTESTTPSSSVNIPTTSDSRLVLIVAVTVSVGGGVLILIIVIVAVACYIHRKRKKARRKAAGRRASKSDSQTEVTTVSRTNMTTVSQSEMTGGTGHYSTIASSYLHRDPAIDVYYDRLQDSVYNSVDRSYASQIMGPGTSDPSYTGLNSTRSIRSYDNLQESHERNERPYEELQEYERGYDNLQEIHERNGQPYEELQAYERGYDRLRPLQRDFNPYRTTLYGNNFHPVHGSTQE